jgi:hypothetical protein
MGNYIVDFYILKISPDPSFPKRGLRVSTEKSEEPKIQTKNRTSW